MPAPVQAFAAEPYSYAEVRSVADGLGLSEPVAVTLVRRGYRTPEQARAFLEADETHSPTAFAGMEEAIGRIRAAIAERRRITVHGDFDVDGVCATALMVSTLRRLGADCDWLIPDRLADGYGLSRDNVERLAERGTSLLLTVDCGITSVEEVRLARELGMDLIVTDHHQPSDELPECPILHPQVCNYPFESLCGTAVAWKLAQALEAGAADQDLDLVALATVADVVPLVGENRALVRRGLAEMRRAQRVGLRALMEAAKCEPTQLDEGDLAFRLAPRINAAGRLYRADAGVELLLTEDAGRAEQIAVELSRANAERRAIEREVESSAEAARRELPEHLLEAPCLVLAGEGWHPGVVGIVASRLVERYHRPVIVISLDGAEGRGSGRSIAGFDLLAALEACSEHLLGFGGHRAAAGLTLRAEDVDAFREAFAAHAGSVLGPEDLMRTERVDAMVGGVGLGLELAEELGRLAPFGMGNPGVRLMVPAAKVSDVRTMGEGKHARFSLHSGAHRALGVAFGRSSLGVGEGEPVDATVRLEVNHWNGSVEPRLVLRELYPLGEGGSGEEATAVSAHRCECDEEEWWRGFEAELGGKGALLLGAAEQTRPADLGPSGQLRRIVSAEGSTLARIAELVSSGAGVLAVCADASRRAELAAGAASLARFNGGGARIACFRCGAAAWEGVAARADGGFALTDYATLLRHGDGSVERFEHVILCDQPASVAAEEAVARASDGGHFLHPLWTEAERDFGLSVLASRAPSRETIAAVYRALREAGDCSGKELRAALTGLGPHPLSPQTAARCFRVLSELELVRGVPSAGAGSVGVVSSEGTELERSAAFRAYSEEHLEAQRYLARPRKP